MNISSKRFYSPAPPPTGSLNNYRKYIGTKTQYEKKALDKTFKSAMNSIDKSINFSTPSRKAYASSNIICLKSAPIESDSDFDTVIDSPKYLPPRQSTSYKTKFDSPVKNTPMNIITKQISSSHQQIMKYFNEFDSSLFSLQNEISEIKNMISNNP